MTRISTDGMPQWHFHPPYVFSGDARSSFDRLRMLRALPGYTWLGGSPVILKEVLAAALVLPDESVAVIETV